MKIKKGMEKNEGRIYLIKNDYPKSCYTIKCEECASDCCYAKVTSIRKHSGSEYSAIFLVCECCGSEINLRIIMPQKFVW